MERVIEAIEIGIVIFIFIGAMELNQFIIRACDQMYLEVEQSVNGDRVLQKDESLFLNEWVKYE